MAPRPAQAAVDPKEKTLAWWSCYYQQLIFFQWFHGNIHNPPHDPPQFPLALATQWGASWWAWTPQPQPVDNFLEASLLVATFTVQRPRGRPFERGREKTGGRKVGARNVASRTVRWAIGEAARKVGGVERLAEWIKEEPRNEYAFWVHVWPRILPLQIQGSGAHGEIELNIGIKHEDLPKYLADHNLPSDVFGTRRPVLENKPPEPRLIAGSSSAGSLADICQTTTPAEGLAPVRSGTKPDPPPTDTPEPESCTGDARSAERDFVELRLATHLRRYG
jgi:hypothetical protein